jgi:hypothetical protein
MDRNVPPGAAMGTHAGSHPMADGRLVDYHSLPTARKLSFVMKFEYELTDGIGLKIATGPNLGDTYPTAKIQKGWLMLYKGLNLSEEAVGFGVPILKRGLHTIFPGDMELIHDPYSSPNHFSARYVMNLEEKISRNGNGTIDNQLVYASKNLLSGLIRGLPLLRSTLTGTSSLLREKFDWQTTYERSKFSLDVNIEYTLLPPEGRLLVEVPGCDFSAQGISEVILMNEQGAHFFDQYIEENGTAEYGDEISCWDEVAANWATFTSRLYKLSFSLPRVNDSKLYRGRELVGDRLAWSGFGYSFPPTRKSFCYEVAIRKLP